MPSRSNPTAYHLKPELLRTGFTWILLCLWALTSEAQIYKWVDEHGKVHYSDKKLSEKASSLDIQAPGLPPQIAVKAADAVPHHGREPARWLLLLAPQLSPKLTDSPRKSIAHFYFGPDCVLPTSLNWKALSERYENFLPNWKYSLGRIDDPVQDLGYRLQTAIPHQLASQLKKTRGLVLRMEIVDIKLDTCAPELGNRTTRRKDNIKYAQNLDNFSLSSFSRSQSWVKVRWTLSSDQEASNSSQGAAPLYVGYTEGVSNNKLRIRGNLQNAILDSLRGALLGLFGEAAFVKHLNQDRVALPSKTRQSIPGKAVKAGDSMLGGLFNSIGGSYVKKAKFAQALSIVNPLKMLITEHYLSRGRWPLNFSDVGLESHKLIEPGVVDGVDIIHEGTISANVSSVFGEGAVIWLSPTDKDIRIGWRCSTNIEAAFVPASCETQ